MQARVAAVKRRKKSVEITAGLSAEPNGFFLFRKRNPLEQREPRRTMHHKEDAEPAENTGVESCSPVRRDPRSGEET
jgi:hypothetical protein